MKRYLSVLLLLLVSVGMAVSCRKHPNIDGFEIEIEKLQVGATSVSIAGSYVYLGTATINSITASVSQRSDFEDAIERDVDLDGHDFEVTVTGLERNTLYYYRFIVDYGGESDHFTESDTFTTNDSSLPSVLTSQVSYIGPHSVLCGGVVTDDGGYPVTARGVCYATEPDITEEDYYSYTVDSCGTGAFVSELTGLNVGTTYYYRAYATNEMGTAFGEEYAFTTNAQSPSVHTVEVMGDGEDAVVVKAEVVADGGNGVTERGVCWSTNEEPTIDDDFATSGSGLGIYTCRIENLQPNTTYYMRAFARNDVGLGFGEVLSFTTGIPVELPTVNTVEIREVTAVSAKCVGNVSANGGAEVTDKGVCWSVTPNPNLSNQHVSAGTGIGSYEVDLSGLAPNTTYHVRAYATNSQGTSYGDALSFTTAEGLPMVNTASVSNISSTSATGGGEVVSQGASAVTERGVCWGTEQNPTINGTHVSNGSGIGSFLVQMTNLTPNLTYYVRAYAINAQGVAYGSEVVFTAMDGLPEVTTSEVVDILANSAKGGGNVIGQGASAVTERGICWATEHHPTMQNSHASSGTGQGGFTCDIVNLNAGTLYYVRAYAVNGQGVAYGDEVSFTTSANMPEVTTGPVSQITQTTAIGSGEVTSSGGATVTERGICWSTIHNPTVGDSHASGGTGVGVFSVQLTGLTTGTVYYVRAYATNSQGTSYGNEMSFTTSANSPTVVTSQVSNIGQTSALGGGNVTDDGGATVTERGICWSTSHNPTISNTHANSGTGMGAFSVEMSGLSPHTTYYVRAYAINGVGLTYGSEVSFTTTQDISAPTVMTSQVTNIGQTTATGGGVVSSDGGAAVTERGVCWSTSHAPSVNGSHASSGFGTGSYSVQLTGLLPNTTYYVRAYAINGAGTSYGNELSFTTAPTIPQVVTSQVSNISQNSALGGGNVTGDGGANVTQRGVCWSMSHNPTLDDSHASSGSGTGSFTVEMTGLSANKTYYVRAYAINSAGTSYGNEVSFTTSQSISAPTVTTSNVTDITQTTATGGGNVTNSGGASVTERGICWSVEHNPTIDDDHGSSGTGTGSFTVSMTDLAPGTRYYVRAYAINSAGTSYGAEESFTTAEYLFPPTVTTSQVTNITQTTALGGGNVTHDGGATVTERGICWSTSHNPTVASSHASNGAGTGSYTVGMTGLTANTTYYVRAYAINGQGTSYGAEVSFTTAQNISAPTVTTANVTNITQTTAIGGGNVTNDGGATVTERGICWSTVQNPTTSSSHVSSGTGMGSFTANMTALTPNTTYYVRAYAINSMGTSYGTEVSFTTLQAIAAPTVTTSPVTGITQTTATSGGNVTADGGASVTDRGICWSTTHNPTTSGSHVSSGTGTGSFTASMSGLTPNTTYYVRAYAVNSAGTSYGDELSFTTMQAIDLPTVTTSSVTDLTQTTATGGGNVTADGGATVTERGICWSTTHNPTTSSSHLDSGSGIGNFQANMTGLTPNTTYYVRAYAINSAGTSYGDEVSFATLPSNVPLGAIDGVFSVSANQQVYFSRGNLQYRASTDTWRFAENQYDFVGPNNTSISPTYNGWIDLFAWGTSGYDHGAVAYQPWSTSELGIQYFAYGNPTANLDDQTGLADWGHNAIINGGNQTNQWRTLTWEEWSYVVNTRNTASGIRYAKATVNDVRGIVLLPDDWNAAVYSLNNVNTGNAHYADNVISASAWATMQAAGAVFLPAAGSRIGLNVSGFSQPGSSVAHGYYWSTTHHSNDAAYIVNMSNGVFSPSFLQLRYLGQSVRVVCPVVR